MAKQNSLQFLSDVLFDKDVVVTGNLTVQGNSSTGETTQVQSDWNETDTTSPAYIQNKPFNLATFDYVKQQILQNQQVQVDYYETNAHSIKNIKNRPFDLTEFTPEITFEFVDDLDESGNITMRSYRLDADHYLDIDDKNVGEVYKVIWDDTEHNMTAKPVLVFGSYLGNGAIYDAVIYASGIIDANEDNRSLLTNETDTGDSFFIAGGMVLGKIDAPLTTHTLRIYQEPKIPEVLVDYIDDSLREAQADWSETDETSPAYIKNKPVISGDGSASVQANWAQEDSTQADYIKNKPNPIEKTLFAVDIISHTDLPAFEYDSTYGAFGTSIPTFATIDIGKTYKVVWDNEVFSCVAQDAGILVPEAIALGNGTGFGLAGNNEPFALVFGNIGVPGVIFFSTVDIESKTHTVRIYEEPGFVANCGVADWNQNEVNGAGYIYNRPFYSEIGIQTIIPEQTMIVGLSQNYYINLSADNYQEDSTYPGFYRGVDVASSPITLSAGTSYEVVWDDEKAWICTAFAFTNPEGYDSIGVGNAKPLNASLPGNEEPFLLIYTPAANNWMTIFTVESGVSHSTYIAAAESIRDEILKNIINLEVGQEYEVSWDGVVYKTTAFECGMAGEPYICVGNGSYMGMTQNEDLPFAIMTMNGVVSGVISYSETGHLHTLKLDGPVEKIVPLDSKFLKNIPWDKIINTPFGKISADEILAEENLTMQDIDGAVGSITTLLNNNVYFALDRLYNIYIQDILFYGKGMTNGGQEAIYIFESSEEMASGLGSSIGQIVYISLNPPLQAFIFTSGDASSLIGQTLNVKISLVEDIINKIDPIYLPEEIGDIGTALDSIMTIQDSLIGGNT